LRTDIFVMARGSMWENLSVRAAAQNGDDRSGIALMIFESDLDLG
jgi:hypothetical protein